MKRSRFLALLAGILILACNIPANLIPSDAGGPGTPVPLATPLSPSTDAQLSPSGQQVNCRSGPGTGWPVVIVVNPGQPMQIAGVNAAGTWWYVENPAAPGTFCWMSAGFVTISGDLSGVPVVAEPPVVEAPPASAGSGVVVTNVTVWIEPEDIQVGGCTGPIQPSIIHANIEVNGTIKLQYHFESEQAGTFPIHSLNFNQAGDKEVTQQFTPDIDPGDYWVRIVIDGMNLSGMDTQATYEIGC